MKWIAALLALAGCLESPPTGPSGGDAACGTLRALHDGFDGALDPGVWTAANVGVSGGAALLASGPALADATMISLASYRLTGGQLTVDLDAADIATGALEVSLIDTAGSALVARLEVGELTVFSAPAGGGDRAVLVDRVFDADQHLLRVREEGGGLFVGVATRAGGEFTEDGPFAVELGDLVHLEIALGPGDAATAVSIESINVDESEPQCAAESLIDDFAASDPRWQVDEQGDCVITVAGQAVLGYSAQAFCALTTLERFDLRDSAYSVELADVGDCAPQPVTLVRLGDDRAIELLCLDDAGSPRLVGRSDDGEFVNAELDEVKHRFLRLRHAGADGVLVFETSPGDGTWSQAGVLGMNDPAPLARTSLRFYLGGETSGGFESVSYDSVGLAP